ncbi:3-carboxy-cis,cis-muconate cycloisomerase [Rhinocladiella mackenziei CBS 650.93]|uniref:3-carboxy-cis,cis-muconate cycloisomerase n=1 Tax=Rhinocladiella mackenziei CBS 650.93 TaxID=1442369 RepID=A0A0D2J112_9EURO|nr:3-carboxy-cis,cis-muconate cycloisomerase [Rhinocladiella mackenziei CBS 650.93]KIX02545.1 3-carboxy-cis,cis-muconate cycloisomerase [Rhinocladiella mackenziei CBS 650.93]
MTSVQDSLIFGNILSTRESAAIWSDKTRTQCYLAFEGALAKAQTRLGIIPQKAADEIIKFCLDIRNIDFDDLRRQTELIGYPVLGVVKQLVQHVNAIEPGLGEWAHWGATTQDVTDTATVIQLWDTLSLFEKTLETIIQSLRTRAEKHKATPMAARSNLQQAVPISFGFKLARLLATFLRHRERLKDVETRLTVLEFSGAAGTLATMPPSEDHPLLGLECQRELAKDLNLKVPEIAWHTERDRIAEFGSLCAMLSGTCAKFALDVKLMTQTEVGEVSEPYVPHRGSSSTMPQKRNPISCAYITAMSSTVRQLSASLFEAMVEDHERSTGPWEIEWIVLPQISTLTHATLKHTADLIAGLEVHEDAMKRNLAISQGAVVSEAVMMGLGPAIGRQYAHDVVYDLCRRSQQEERPLLELLCENEEIRKKMSREQCAKLCDPANYLGYSEAMVQRVLKLADEPRQERKASLV